MTPCTISIEDEHGIFGGTLSLTCDSLETAQYWTKQHLKKHASGTIFRFSDELEAWKSLLETDFRAAVKDFEWRVQHEYDNWEYGGRFYISISPLRLITMSDLVR